MVAYNLAVASFAGVLLLPRPRASACDSRAGDLSVGLGAGQSDRLRRQPRRGLRRLEPRRSRADFDYWHASRVIGPEQFKTINEFPFFTFFHADLHPHLLAFPYFIAAFAVAHRWMEAGADRRRAARVALACFSWP